MDLDKIEARLKAAGIRYERPNPTVVRAFGPCGEEVAWFDNGDDFSVTGGMTHAWARLGRSALLLALAVAPIVEAGEGTRETLD